MVEVLGQYMPNDVSIPMAQHALEEETPSDSPSSGSAVERILRSMRRATRDIGDADGVVLELADAALPRVTGWFHSDVAPGFSATLPHIVYDALTQSGTCAASRTRSAPRTTWNHVKIGSAAGVIGELWLYRGQRMSTASESPGTWVQSSPVMRTMLQHIGEWRSDPLDVESLFRLNEFARELNGLADLDGVCRSVATRFRDELRATSVLVELFDRDSALRLAACEGPAPIKDGVYTSRLSENVHDVVIGETLADEWLFDLFPLTSTHGLPLGAVTCFWTKRDEPVVSLPIMNSMTEHASSAIERAIESRQTASVFWSAARVLADAVDARDAFTRHHAARVARYSKQIAELLGLSEEETTCIEVAGLLHDVGKIGVPDRVLQMSGELDPSDWDLIRRHPEVGSVLAKSSPELAPVAPLIRHHHERYDGTGYPSGLSGEDIPIGARIISVVEAFDTLVTGRPYQSPWNVERTLKTLESLGGSQFDASIVQTFSRAIRNGTIQVDVPAPARTGDLDLHRWIGAEARAFSLLQRISNEVGELIEIGRFLSRLKEIIESEFPHSVVDIFIRDLEHDHLVAISDGTRPHLVHDGVYVLKSDWGVVGWVARNGVAQNIDDVREDPRYFAPSDTPMRSELAVPMALDDQCIGVLNLESPKIAAYSSTDERVLENVASYVARAVQVAELHSQVKQLNDVDSMTGLLNHRAFYRTLEAEVERATRSNGQVSVAIIDVDSFKVVNDSLGHVWGDDVIRRLAAILSGSVRHGDAVARYGGDEFALIMPSASRELIEHRMHAIEERIATTAAERPFPSISWGIASFPDDGRRPTELVAQADAAMYASKQRDEPECYGQSTQRDQDADG